MKILCFYSHDKTREKFSQDFDDIFFSLGGVQDLNSDDFEKFKEVEIITSFIDSIFTAEILEKFPNLKLIATQSTGTDHIDLEYCRRKGIEVKNVPDYGSNTVAEHNFALLLALSKKVFYSYEEVEKDLNFSRMGMEEIRGFDLAGKTIGVLGTGKIGKNIIRIAKGFQMSVIAYDIYPDKEFAQKNDFFYVEFDDLLERSDIISVNVPLNGKTFHLLSFSQFEKMKEGVIVLNTSRGEVIETQALFESLKNKKVSLAGLDVLEQEYCLGREIRESKECEEEIKKINLELIKMNNVIVTPHNAFNTIEALDRIFQKTIENIKEFIEQ